VPNLERNTLAMNADSLLLRALDGDASAWSQLVAKYSALVYGTALRTGLDAEAAADVAQLVWVALLEGGHAIRDPRALPKWLAVTSRRIALRQIRRSRAVGGPIPEDYVDEGPSAEELLDREQRAAEIRAAAGELSEKCRNLLITLFWSGASDYAAVARELDMPVGSIGPSRARCLARLHKILKRRGFRP
jgi:RNA polymerase sigma factor (sigma-70 family)